MNLSRRDVLRSALMAGFAQFLPMPAFAAGATATTTRKHLVMIELSGGNDADNMLIPFQGEAIHPDYAACRPGLAAWLAGHAPATPLKLSTSGTTSVRAHPAWSKATVGANSLAGLWQDGEMAVVRRVGLTSPVLDHSHFEAIDQWYHAGVASTTGWLTPMLASAGGRGLVLGNNDLGPLRGSNASYIMSDLNTLLSRVSELAPPEELMAPAALTPALAHVLDIHGRCAGLDEAWGESLVMPAKTGVAKPDGGNELDLQLYQAATAISNHLDAQVIHCRMRGFDLHSGLISDDGHDQLLRQLSQALLHFRHHWAKQAWDDGDVLVMVYSEFGRRIGENGSLGTDHGGAGDVLLLGKPVASKAVHYGSATWKQAMLDDFAVADQIKARAKDASVRVDLRSVYATVGAWLSENNALTIGGFGRIGGLIG